MSTDVGVEVSAGQEQGRKLNEVFKTFKENLTLES